MNPFSKFLRQWSKDPRLGEFVAYWDRLERLTIQVYRQKMGVETAEAEFAEVWPWLRKEYRRWATSLEPYWQQTTAAGQPTQTDPFLLLLNKQSPADIPGDGNAMQHLPAAREALNRFLS
jgi:hypothetical protein